eukprot:scaffold15583_cov119-Skeletonema_dohrnii-CCMP3373.AAC.5
MKHPYDRFLQEEGGCRPELSEQDLRDLMNGSRAECNQVSIEYTNEYFDGILGEFWKVFSADSCWTELCNSPDIFYKLMFDHAMQCANVEFDVDECIKDQIFSMMFAGPDSYDDDDDYYGGGGLTSSNPNHRVLRSLQDVMNGESDAECVEVNEFELAFFASFILMEAEGQCAELDISVTPEDIAKASADLVTLFGSPHCFGGPHACPDDGGNNGNIVEPNQGHGQLDPFNIAVKYVEECASIELPDSCLTMKTIDFFKSWGSSPSMHRSLQLQDSDNSQDCIVPEVDEALLNALAFDDVTICNLSNTGNPLFYYITIVFYTLRCPGLHSLITFTICLFILSPTTLLFQPRVRTIQPLA